jgi:chemotaxis protein histidine kinase CheA
MKKLLTILIGCSMALTSGAIAQQEEASQPPKAKHPAKGQQPARETKPAEETKPAQNVKPTHETKPMPESANKEQTETRAPAETKGAPKHLSTPESSALKKDEKDATAGKQQAEQFKKEQNTAKDAATTKKTASPNPTSVSSPASTNSSTAPAVTTNSPANAASPQANKVNPQAKKPDPQVVQKIKTEHASFKAQPKPDKVPAVSFNQSYRIEGSDRWEGQKYERFRSYRPEMHDQGWYQSHYTRVEVIAGGAYYWNEGYWYPAWGYNSSTQYYPYDGPIYVGSRAEPPDRVIAEVQAILQQEGYYQGEVDGLLGPLTRQALTGYQADNGLYTTAAIDEPTLASLDLG